MTNFPSPLCRKHKGVKRYGVAEFLLEDDDRVSICSFQFSYSVDPNSSDSEKRQLFDRRKKVCLHQTDCEIAEFLAATGKQTTDVEILTEESFATSKEARQCLCKIQVTNHHYEEF